MKTLIIVTGPTASGKTGLAIELAESLHTEIVSADSRQIFKSIPIGTAAPTPEELAHVKHHFVQTLDLNQYYSAALYEEQALKTLEEIWQHNDYAVMCGGSMMYIDAITHGIDPLPTITQEIRSHVLEIYNSQGLDRIIDLLRNLDPEILLTSDLKNHRRLIHALEITLQSGKPYSSLRSGQAKKREFRIIKVAIDYPRERLFERINARVDRMIADGLIDEARVVYPLRHLNSLNTVGYKELFNYFDGNMGLDTAIARIAKNTRVYAKKQLLWLSKDPNLIKLNPSLPLLQQVLKLL